MDSNLFYFLLGILASIPIGFAVNLFSPTLNQWLKKNSIESKGISLEALRREYQLIKNYYDNPSRLFVVCWEVIFSNVFGLFITFPIFFLFAFVFYPGYPSGTTDVLKTTSELPLMFIVFFWVLFGQFIIRLYLRLIMLAFLPSPPSSIFTLVKSVSFATSSAVTTLVILMKVRDFESYSTRTLETIKKLEDELQQKNNP